MSKKWEPDGGLEAFKERALIKRGKGYTWRKIASEEPVGFSTLYDFWSRNPEIKKDIDKRELEEIRENIHQTLLELAIKNKNVVALIFLAKSKLKMFDQPAHQTPDPTDAEAPTFGGMTREEWKKKHEDRQIKLKATSK